MRHPKLLVAVSLVLAACGDVLPSNPYDPRTPLASQARCSIDGRLTLVEEGAPLSALQAELAAATVTLLASDGTPLAGPDGAALRATLVPVAGAASSTFAFNEVPSGSWRLDVAGLGARFVGPGAPSFELQPGARLALGDLRFVSARVGAGPGRIEGRVKLDGARGGPRRVQLYRLEEAGVVEVGTVSTDREESFAFTQLPVGTYAVEAQLDGFTPDYRVDVVVGEQSGAQLAYVFDGDNDALTLHAITAVLVPGVAPVEGTVYVSGRNLPLQLLAFGGVTGMRVSTDRTFTTEGGATQAYEQFQATRDVPLPDVQGPVTIHAQFEARSDAGFAFESDVFSVTVIRDSTPPEIVALQPTALAADVNGLFHVLEDGAVLALDVDASDRHSAVRGVRVVQPADGIDPADGPFDLVNAPGGLVRLVRTVALTTGEGEKRVFVTLQDRAGNISEPAELVLDVDTTDPVVPFTVTNVVGGKLASRLARLAFDTTSATGDLPVRMVLGQKPLPPVSNAQAFTEQPELLLSGAHGQVVTVVARLTDTAGRTVDVEAAPFTLDLSGTLSGTVALEGVPTYATNHGNVRVRLFAPGTDPETAAATLETVTDAQGRWSLGPVPEGDGWRLLFTANGFTALEVLAPTIAPSGHHVLPVARLALSRGTLTGVFLLEDQRSAADAHGGIVVTATMTGGRTLSATAVTAPSGEWRIEGLPATIGNEQWRVDAQASGYRRATADTTALASGAVVVINADAVGVAQPLLLGRVSGDFDLCAATGPCIPLSFTRTPSLRVALRSTTGVTDVRVQARTAFSAADTTPTWRGSFNAATPITVDATGADGTIDVYLQTKVEGVPGTVLRASLVLDTVAPTISTLSIDGGAEAFDPRFTNRTNVVLRAEADAGTGLVAPLDGLRVVFASSAPAVFPALAARCESGVGCTLPLPGGATVAEGPHKAWAIACDLAGNCGTTPTVAAITYDATPPSVANGVAIAPLSPTLTTASGTTYLRSAAYSVQVSVGTAKTAGGAPLLAPDGTTVADVAAYRFGFDAALGGTRLSAFDVTPAAAAQPRVDGPSLASGDGTYRVYAQLADAAGNVTSLTGNPWNFPLVLDTRAPGVAFSLAADAAVTRTTDVALTVGLSPTDPATRTWLATDGGRFDTYTERTLPLGPGATTFTLPAAAAPGGDGTYTVYARFFDAAGNATDRQDSIRLDRTPPEVVLTECTSCTTNAGQVYTNAATQQVTLSVLATDAGGRVESLRISVDGAAATTSTYTGTTTVTLPATDGAHDLAISAVDDAGNTSTARTLRVILDRQAPTVSVQLNSGAASTRSASVTVDLTATDATSGVAGLRLTSTGTFSGPTQPFSARLAYLLDATVDGSKTVTVEVSDAAGNVATAARSIVLDTDAPTGTVSIASAAAYTTARDVQVALTWSTGTTSYALSATSIDCAAATYATATGTGTTQALTLAAGDGSKTAYACLRDAAGNTRGLSDDIVLDTTAPTGSVSIDGGAASTRQRSVVVALSASSDVALVALSEATTLDCTTATYAAIQASVPVLTTADGTRTVTACFKDAAGNTGTASDTIVVDTAVPTATFAINGGAAVTASASVTLVLSSASLDAAQVSFTNGTTLDCALATYEPYSASRAFTLTGGDGTRTVTGCLKDTAGNTSQLTDTIVLDTAKPTVSLSLDAGATYATVATGRAAVVTHANDVTGYALSAGTLDCAGATYTTTSGTTTSTTVTLPTGDGTKTVSVCVRDAAGNTASASDDLVLDTTAPSPLSLECASCVSAGGVATTNAANRQATLALVATDNLGSVSTVRTRVFDPTSGAFTTTSTAYTGTLVVTLPNADGVHSLLVTYVDPAGNASAESALDVTLDRVAPVPSTPGLSGTIADGGSSATLTNTTAITVTATATGTPTEVQLANDAGFSGATWQAASGTFRWILNPNDGAQSVHVRFRDAAGNVSGGVSASITLDRVAPTSLSLQLAGGASATNNVTVAATLAAAGATQMRLSTDGALDGESWVTFATTTTVSLPASEGLKTVLAVVRDAAGNESSVATAFITLDRTAPAAGTPAVSIKDNPAGFVNSTAVQVTLSASGADTMSIGCDGTVDTEPWVPYATLYTCVVDGTNALKSITAAFRDAAGNVTNGTADTTFLDTNAPASPLISTSPTITSTASFQVALGLPGADGTVTGATPTQAFAYQLRGAQYAEWTDCGTALTAIGWSQDAACSGPPFTFNLGTNRDNRLFVRARDRAGNVSAEDTVLVKHDNIAPGVVQRQNSAGVISAWAVSSSVDAGNGYLHVEWEPPSDADVAGYRIYYGYASGSTKSVYTGQFATNGVSPIDVGKPCNARSNGNDCAFVLNGVPNGTRIWVNIAAYDATQSPGPNEGNLTSGVGTTPATVVPRYEANIAPSAFGSTGTAARGLELKNGLAYIATGRTGVAGGRFVIYDLADPSNPALLGTATQSAVAVNFSHGFDVYLNGSYAYVADGTNGLRTIDVGDPTTPVLVDADTMSGANLATAVDGQGDLIVVASALLGSVDGGELRVFTTAPGSCSNTSSPANPCLVGSFNGTTYKSYTDIAMQGNHVALTASGRTAIYLVDVSNPAVPTLAGTCATANGADSVQFSGGLLYFSYLRGIGACNLATITAPVEVASARSSLGNFGKKLAVYGSNVAVFTSGGLELFETRPTAGSTTTVAAGTNADSVGTDESFGFNSPSLFGVRMEGNYAVAAAGSTGVNVYRLTSIRGVQLENTFSPATAASNNDGVIYGHHAVVTQGDSGLEAIHLNPQAPSRFALTSAGTFASAMVNSGDLFVAVDRTSGTVSGRRLNHQGFTTHGSVVPAGVTSTNGVTVSWPYAFLSTGTTQSFNSLRVVSLRPPYAQVASVAPAVTVGSPSVAPGKSVLYRDRLYVANGRDVNNVTTVEIFNVSNPLSPTRVGAWVGTAAGNGEGAGDLALVGSRLIVNVTAGFKVLSLANPDAPTLVTSVSTGTTGLRMAASGRFVYLSGIAVMVYDITQVTSPQLLAFHQFAVDGMNMLPAGNLLTLSNQYRETQFIRLR